MYNHLLPNKMCRNPYIFFMLVMLCLIGLSKRRSAETDLIILSYIFNPKSNRLISLSSISKRRLPLRTIRIPIRFIISNRIQNPLLVLKNAGFDMVSVANNHSMDFLQKGFLDTLTHLDKAGLLYVGGGLNAQEAYRAKSVTLKGKKVKFLAFSRFIPTGDWFAGPNKPGIAQAYDRKARTRCHCSGT